jgi:hypothetical protein
MLYKIHAFRKRFPIFFYLIALSLINFQRLNFPIF